MTSQRKENKMSDRVIKCTKENMKEVVEYWRKEGISLNQLGFRNILEFPYIGMINGVMGAWSEAHVNMIKPEIIGAPKTFPRMMRVWDDGLVRYSRMVLLICESGVYAASSAIRDEYALDSVLKFGVDKWKHAEEIIEPRKVTRAYLEDLLDGPFKIVD